jgi:hypothetical protein
MLWLAPPLPLLRRQNGQVKEEKTFLVISYKSRGVARSSELQCLEGRGVTDEASYYLLGPSTNAETPSGMWNGGSGRFHGLPPWCEVAARRLWRQKEEAESGSVMAVPICSG